LQIFHNTFTPAFAEARKEETHMSSAAKSPKTIAIAALLLGAAAIAFAPVLVRVSDISPTASAFWRMALAAPVLWVWVFAAERNSAPAAGQWKLLFLAGIFFAADLGTWHWSILFTSVANATLELNFAAIFVTILAWLLFRHRVSRLFVFALLVTFAGAGLLIGPNIGGTGKALLGDGLGILAGFFYACYMLAIKAASSKVSTARIMAVSTTVAAIVLAPYALLNAEHFVPQSAHGWLVLAGLALVVHVLGQSLIAYGFSHLPASFSSVSLLLQPVLAAVYAWALLSERVEPIQFIGGAIVLLGIYLAKRGS
jgi:drug/metabolite transporter (DMT)-like permease